MKKLESLIKVVEPDYMDPIKGYKNHLGHLLDAIESPLAPEHEKHYKYIKSEQIKELRAVIRAGMFMSLIDLDDYAGIMDEITSIEILINKGEKIC